MKTIIGSFDTASDAQGAVARLTDAGFDADRLGLVAPERVLQEHLFNGARPVGELARAGALGGAAMGGLALGGLVGALVLPGAGGVLALGALASTIGAAAAGAGVGAVAGGLVGALIGVGIPEQDADFYAEVVRRGGVLVTVRIDDDHAAKALDIMRQEHMVDAETRRKEWWRPDSEFRIESDAR